MVSKKTRKNKKSKSKKIIKRRKTKKGGMNSREKALQEQIKLRQDKDLNNMDKKLINMEEGKYLAPVNAAKDPNGITIRQKGTMENILLKKNQEYNDQVDFAGAEKDNWTFGGKRRKRL